MRVDEPKRTDIPGKEIASENIVIPIVQKDAAAGVVVNEVADEQVPLRAAIVAGFWGIHSFVEVQAETGRGSELVADDEVIGGADAQSNAAEAVVETGVIPNGGAVSVEDGDTRIAISQAAVVLHKGIVAVSVKHDSVATILP